MPTEVMLLQGDERIRAHRDALKQRLSVGSLLLEELEYAVRLMIMSGRFIGAQGMLPETKLMPQLPDKYLAPPSPFRTIADLASSLPWLLRVHQSMQWVQQMPNGLMTVQRLICPAASLMGGLAAPDGVLSVDWPKVEEVMEAVPHAASSAPASTSKPAVPVLPGVCEDTTWQPDYATVSATAMSASTAESDATEAPAQSMAGDPRFPHGATNFAGAPNGAIDGAMVVPGGPGMISGAIGPMGGAMGAMGCFGAMGAGGPGQMGTLGSEMGDGFGRGLLCAVRETGDTLDLSGKLTGGDRPTMVAVVAELMRGLASLGLRKNKLTDGEGLKMFATLQTNTTLTQLDLGDNELGAESGKAMVEALKMNTTIRTVALDGDVLSIEELTTAASINLSKSLREKRLGDASGIVIAHLITRNQSLTQLDLGSTPGWARYRSEATRRGGSPWGFSEWQVLRAESGKALAEALQTNTTLTQLSLNNNKLGDAGGCALAMALQTNTTLTQLDLDVNELGAESSKAMGEALKMNTTLTQLSLNSNQLGDAGGCALAMALQTNTTLTQLSLGGNELGDEGGMALADALSGRTMHWLDLSSNRISSSTWDAIAMAASKGAFDRVTGMPLQHQLLCCLKAVDLTNLTITNQISMSSWEYNDSGTISHLRGMYPNGYFGFLSIFRSEGPLTNEETRRLSTIPFDDSRSVISSAASSPFKTVAALRDAWRSGLGCAFCSGGPCDNYVSHDSRDHVEENGRDSYLTWEVRQWNVCALCSSEISCEEGRYDERIPGM
jgi:hypothetical protein